MNLTDILQSISLGVIIIGGVIGFIVNARKAKGERNKTTVETGSEAIDATGNALKIANDAAAQVIVIQKQMHDMRVKYDHEIEGLKMEIDEWKYETACERAEKEHVKQWADELVHQIVYEFRGTPKKMKPFIVPERML